MPRSRGRKDANQKQIEKELKEIGAFFIDLSQYPGQFDLLVWYMGIWGLWEIKNPDHPPSKQRLSPAEQKLADKMRDRGITHFGIAKKTSDITRSHCFWRYI